MATGRIKKFSVQFYISGQIGNYFQGYDINIPYTGNFTKIRNFLNLPPVSPNDPNCRVLIFSFGKLINEMAFNCNEPMIGSLLFITLYPYVSQKCSSKF
jgi:hypothetical protein